MREDERREMEEKRRVKNWKGETKIKNQEKVSRKLPLNVIPHVWCVQTKGCNLPRSVTTRRGLDTGRAFGKNVFIPVCSTLLLPSLSLSSSDEENELDFRTRSWQLTTIEYSASYSGSINNTEQDTPGWHAVTPKANRSVAQHLRYLLLLSQYQIHNKETISKNEQT